VSVALTGPFDTAQLPKIADEPVTVTVARSVAPGYEAQFLAWADEAVATLRKFHGFLGAGVYHPGPDGGDYQIVFRFIDGVHLRVWERSPQRAVLMARSERFVTGERVQRTVGVEDFFDLPMRAEPKRTWWRKVITDVLWVYPVALLMSVVVAPALVALPLGWRVLVSASMITLVMSFVVGPMRHRLRRRRSL
jgi:antibiotic biosynthesis monooxygenase (ABM) superfamily enzyme